ncbi:MAG: hypothetical protein AABW56_04510 [Nanoarchaeota archaeon]
MDKKGAELSFNVIIIAILVILVLVIVGAFFAGSFSNLVKILTGQGIDSVDAASNACSSKCLTAQNYGTQKAKETSSYCRSAWNFDTDGDGNVEKDAEGNLRKYHCYESPIGQSCPGVQEFCPTL